MRRIACCVAVLVSLGAVGACTTPANPAPTVPREVPDPPTRADYQGATVEPGVAPTFTDVLYVDGGLEGCPTGSDVDCPGTFHSKPYFGSQTLDVYSPPSGPATGRPVIVWIHGGLSVTGDKTDVGGVDYPGNLLARQVARGYVVVSLNYRLNPLVDGPEGTIIPTDPVAAEDLDVAVRFIKAHAGVLGIDPGRIVLWGHSWGGWAALLHATAPGLHTPGWLPPALSSVDPKVAGVVAEAAPSDLVSTLPIAFAEVDRTGDVGPVDVDALDVAQLAQDSPVVHADASDSPIYAMAGPDDPLVPASDPNAMADRYAALGRPDLYRLDVTDRVEATPTPWAWRRHLPHPAANRTELERWLDARRS
jgi:acetyl esterase/lipase